MIWICRTVPVFQVTTKAGGGQCCVVVVGVALQTRHSRMSSREREKGGVVERGAQPRRRRMACFARCRESR